MTALAESVSVVVPSSLDLEGQSDLPSKDKLHWKAITLWLREYDVVLFF